MEYFTSDLHYNHYNIVKGISNWDNKSSCRDFNSLEEHNRTIITNINKVVGLKDELYILGDVVFGNFSMLQDFRYSLKCQNIHVILGNHDKVIRQNLDKCGELFSSISEKKEIQLYKNLITLNHYSQRTWNKASKGSWMLFGHSHGSMQDYKDKKGNLFKTLDVGIDTHPEFRPYSYTEISDIMKKRVPLSEIDHH